MAEMSGLRHIGSGFPRCTALTTHSAAVAQMRGWCRKYVSFSFCRTRLQCV